MNELTLRVNTHCRQTLFLTFIHSTLHSSLSIKNALCIMCMIDDKFIGMWFGSSGDNSSFWEKKRRESEFVRVKLIEISRNACKNPADSSYF